MYHLGSGKTTLLSHILSNYEGLRVAILVNDMGEINIDAALVKKTTGSTTTTSSSSSDDAATSVSIRQREEHMVEMSNGCICCTLREDLLDPEDQRTISHLLCDQVEFANVIVLNKCDLLSSSKSSSSSTFLSTVGRNIHGRDGDNVRSNGEDELQRIRQFIQSMNPTAKVIESTYSAVPLHHVLGTGLFSISEAERHDNWLQEARIGEHTPETEEYGIGSFTYRATRPFLPNKFHDVLENMLNRTHPPFSVGDDDDNNDAINPNGETKQEGEEKHDSGAASSSSSSSSVSVVLRAKGFVWLANCLQLQGDFSLAGHHFSLTPGNPWWAEIDKSHWPDGLEETTAPLWHEPHGDRQQEVVIIGQSLNEGAITVALNRCLVSDEEFERGQEYWYRLCSERGNPFEETWDAAIQEARKEHHNHHHHSHEHGHDHGHGHGHDHEHVHDP